jgi:UDP-N-acetylmuramate: L-alanyl-gamma-D-glutamyl-meso-diaminopimelate ligase
MHESCHLYLLPIGGTATTALAGLAHEAGFRVSGVDTALYPPTSEILASLGIAVRQGFDPAAIPPDVDRVVIGNALPRTNPEVQEVLRRGLPYTSQAAALGEYFCRDARTVVLAGTHGKTTTTALTAHIFERCGLDPTVMIGGVPCGGRPWRLGAGGWTVVEGDEYNTAFFDRGPKFLHYFPHLFVVGNLEFDHSDIYPDLDAIVAAFRAGVARTVELGGTVVANAGDAGARRAVEGTADVVWYGEGEGVDLRATSFTHRDGQLVAQLVWRGRPWEVTVPLVGRHNLDNLLAACTCALLAGAEPAAVAAAAATFPGVRRRLELVGTVAGVSVVDDFAHHPTAARLTLKGARQRFPGRRLVAALEPRSLTAGRALFAQAWEEALAVADSVVIAQVFHRQRLPSSDLLDRDALVAALRRRGVKAEAVPEGVDPLPVLRGMVRAGDVVVCMSSGSFDGLPTRLLAALSQGAT